MEQSRNKENKGYRNLIVGKELRQLVKLIYEKTEDFPRSEDYGLRGQMRRAAVSGLSNLVEGYARAKNYPKDSLKFYSDADSSLAELEAQLEVALDNLNEFTQEDYAICEGQRARCAYLLKRFVDAVRKDRK